MFEKLDGSTRLFVVLGDPIAQVKSPSGMTHAFQKRGVNAVVVPMHVTPSDFDAFVRGVGRALNLDGIIVTVPHKFAAFRHCVEATARARILGAVNVLRREAGGNWYGDMLDGIGFVGGIRSVGFDPAGKRALLVGAGGAGSAIALALVDEGVSELAIHDESAERRDGLIGRLRDRRPEVVVRVGSADPTGFELVVNATPAGMKPGDELPVLANKLHASTFVGDVITAPVVTPLIEQARHLGCATQIGLEMFNAEATLMLDFLLAPTTRCDGERSHMPSRTAA
jgi:shikimate dehydrogenase